MDGFGAIHREPGEPVFHQVWESRVFGMSMLGAGLPPITLDARRHQLERLSPAQYLASSYYERWLARIDQALIEAGILSRKEIEERMQLLAARPDLSLERREDAAETDRIAKVLGNGRPTSRKIRQKPRFVAGDRIKTRNLNPPGHTRLPRYARAKRGVIVAHHGAHVFPDTNAHGLGENPQHLYTVRIATRELWGDSAAANESVFIDLWESYLQKDKADSKSSRSSRTSTAKKRAAKVLPRSLKVRAGRGAAAKGRRLAKSMRRSR
jgi:nitrile hydratase